MKEKTFAARPERYTVAFRKMEQGEPACQWVEVTIVGGTREVAVNHAKKLVGPLSGLVYSGTS